MASSGFASKTVTEDAFSRMNATVLHDAYQKLFGPRASRSQCVRTLTPIGHSAHVTGYASTMKLTHVGSAESGGRKQIMSAYDSLPGRSLLVVEVAGDAGGGVIGDLIAHRLAKIGVCGAVVDGPVRDVNGILDHGLMVWASEVTISGMAANELKLELALEVCVGGVHVGPGDLVAADRDGIFVVPRSRIDEVTGVALSLLAEEEEAHRKIESGLPILAAYPNIRAE